MKGATRPEGNYWLFAVSLVSSPSLRTVSARIVVSLVMIVVSWADLVVTIVSTEVVRPESWPRRLSHALSPTTSANPANIAFT
jgi:hypothetical protein